MTNLQTDGRKPEHQVQWPGLGDCHVAAGHGSHHGGDGRRYSRKDFSKIMARFGDQMPLNSADVAEVIQTRLLVQDARWPDPAGQLHDREENNLKTLFDFTDGSIKLKNFRWPRSLRLKLSVPALSIRCCSRWRSHRSPSTTPLRASTAPSGSGRCWACFQEVAKKLADQPVGGLATFDLMFEGIRTALKSSVQQSIQIAEKKSGHRSFCRPGPQVAVSGQIRQRLQADGAQHQRCLLLPEFDS